MPAPVFAETSKIARPRGDIADVFDGEMAIQPDRVGEIHFREDDRGGVVKNRRILFRFVFALGHRGEHDLLVFPEIKGGGADEIADVFDKEEFGLREVEVFDGVQHHVGIEMADVASGDLDGGDTGFAEAAGIIVGGAIPDDRGTADAVTECGDRFFQKGRFA